VSFVKGRGAVTFVLGPVDAHDMKFVLTSNLIIKIAIIEKFQFRMRNLMHLIELRVIENVQNASNKFHNVLYVKKSSR